MGHAERYFSVKRIDVTSLTNIPPQKAINIMIGKQLFLIYFTTLAYSGESAALYVSGSNVIINAPEKTPITLAMVVPMEYIPKYVNEIKLVIVKFKKAEEKLLNSSEGRIGRENFSPAFITCLSTRIFVCLCTYTTNTTANMKSHIKEDKYLDRIPNFVTNRNKTIRQTFNPDFNTIRKKYDFASPVILKYLIGIVSILIKNTDSSAMNMYGKKETSDLIAGKRK